MPRKKKTIPIVTENTKPTITRTCGGCTACCEGWLSGEAHGRKFFRGMPCYYKGSNGCSIYEDRPEMPCKVYRCAWLANPDLFPEWMKPTESKVLMTAKEHQGHTYLHMLEMDQRMDPRVLSWAFTEYLSGRLPNLRWQVDGAWYLCGSKEFVKAMESI